MTRLLMTLAATALLAGVAEAGYPGYSHGGSYYGSSYYGNSYYSSQAYDSGPYVGQQEDGYIYAGGGYWQRGSDYYTRSYHEYPGYQTYYQYGYAYQKPVTYWYWRYTIAHKPASSITPESGEAARIDFLKQREKIQGAIAAKAQADESHLKWLDKVGVTPPFPGVGFLGGSGYAAVTGDTLYGHGGRNVLTFSQVADFYGPFDPNILMQGSVAMARDSLKSATEANSQMNNILGGMSQAAERLQAQKLQGEIELEKIRSVQTNRVTTTIQKTEPASMPNAEGKTVVSHRRKVMAKSSCIGCHSGTNPAGGLDMTKKLTPEQKLSVADRVMRPITDEGHMPAAKDGKPGRQMTFEETLELLKD